MFGEQFVLLPGALVFCLLGVPLALRGPSAVVLNQLLHRGKNTAQLRRVPDGRRHKRGFVRRNSGPGAKLVSTCSQRSLSGRW